MPYLYSYDNDTMTFVYSRHQPAPPEWFPLHVHEQLEQLVDTFDSRKDHPAPPNRDILSCNISTGIYLKICRSNISAWNFISAALNWGGCLSNRPALRFGGTFCTSACLPPAGRF